MTEKKNKKILYIEILGDLATAAIKFVFGIIGNSSVMIAEGFHSVADTANQIFLLVGVYSSKRTPDIISKRCLYFISQCDFFSQRGHKQVERSRNTIKFLAEHPDSGYFFNFPVD